MSIPSSKTLSSNPVAASSSNPPPVEASSDWAERYGRQVILPGVGADGQKKWADSTVLLAGEGPALQSALTALSSSGVNKIFILPSQGKDAPFPSFQTSGRQMQVLPPSFEKLPEASIALVLSDDGDFRRKSNRVFRKNPRPVLYGWTAGSGMALFLSGTPALGESCPCFECFEVMNPKAFSKGEPEVHRVLGATAASEALQWILSGSSPLLYHVWITSLSEGVSFHHKVQSTPKCPARLGEQGIFYTP